MCEFCKEIVDENEKTNREEFIQKDNDGKFYICCHTGGSDYGVVENVKFCPICGRNLTEV